MGDDRSHENSVGGGLNRSIFDHIISIENLFNAWKEFKKDKGRKLDVIRFSLNLENNIFGLRDELLIGRWKCGGYKKFSIKDPKPRVIHKATVRDRLLYQAIYRVLYPLFDSAFIFDSYSSRRRKGTHAGIKRLSILLRKLSRNYIAPVWALKCDVKRFFDSIDHEILLSLIKQKVSCPETIRLLGKIIDSFHKTPGKGLPLGNVTSQIFANIYLNSFDHHIKHDLGVKYYLRYCDDFVILTTKKESLLRLVPMLEEFLIAELRLELHPQKIEIRGFHQGIDFLGAVLLPYRTVVRTKTKKRILKKSVGLLKELKNARVTKEKLNQSIASYLGHLSHSKSREINHLLRSIRAKVQNFDV